jgi:hypothetical protein
MSARRCYLREGADYLDDARPFASIRAARDAYATSARELARYGQAHDASIHIATSRDELAEYPDYVLTLGPRGGVRMERA